MFGELFGGVVCGLRFERRSGAGEGRVVEIIDWMIGFTCARAIGLPAPSAQCPVLKVSQGPENKRPLPTPHRTFSTSSTLDPGS